MPEKPKIGFYWCGSCGGCEESVVDLALDLLVVVDAVDIVFFPVGMDFKREDVEALPDGAMAACFINGCIRTSEQEEMSALLRQKSQNLIAYGACATSGGIPGLANQFTKEQILRFVYETSPSTHNEAGVRPQVASQDAGHALTIPALRDRVRALDQVVDVDYYLPGCPPTPELLKNAVLALLNGQLPEKGSVLAPDVALCDQCRRKDTKPTELKYTEFIRPHLVKADPNTCFLAQGIVCMGPSTRSGCGALCIEGNMPCSGCFGATSRVRDQGAKMLSTLAASVTADNRDDAERILAGIPDPVGTFYRYSLPHSLLRGSTANLPKSTRNGGSRP
ncbi:MAG: oxidoreductase [Chthonomonadales bacterium]|nr:oxidoreductase [Chthonomonadales bacterium]